MAVRFLTNVDKQAIDEQIDSLSKCSDSSIVISETPPEDTSALWVDTTDGTSDDLQNGNSNIELDTTLKKVGKAAEAAAVGTALAQISQAIGTVSGQCCNKRCAI